MSHASRTIGQSRPRRLAVTLLLSLPLSGAGCVSVPAPAGPVSVEGTIPPAGDIGVSRARPAPGATRGPLVLLDAQLQRGPAGFRWRVTVSNPADATFEATLVVSLLDEREELFGVETREFLIGPGDERELSGELDEVGAPRRFRIDYWVELLPPPDRRIERIGP